jgi:hypothetical protein
MGLLSILWIVFIINIIAFIVVISIASTCVITNCTTPNIPNTCENGFTITDSYNRRKQCLQIANVLSWIIIILYIFGIIASDIFIKKSL